MKGLYIILIGFVLLPIWGCSECTDVTYTTCQSIKKPNTLIITTPDGQWKASKVYLDFLPIRPDLFSPDYSNIGYSVECFYPDEDVDKPNHYYLSVSVNFDHWSPGDIISLSDTKRVTSFVATCMYNGTNKTGYNIFYGKAISGTIKIISLNSKDVHIQLSGLKISCTPEKGEYAGKTIEWSVSPIDDECKPQNETLCQDTAGQFPGL